MNREQYAHQNTARMEKILNSSAREGLSEAEAAKRLRTEGPNCIARKRRAPIVAFLLTILKNGSLPIYLLAVALAAPFLRLAVVLPSLLYLSFLLVYGILFVRREHLLHKHEASLLPYVRVVRGGKVRAISPQELVRGDLLLLSPGDVLCSYAHVTTDEPIEVYCVRGDKSELRVKHGGDCFDTTEEAFNTLSPGDVIRGGTGQAFVTEKWDEREDAAPFEADTLKNHGNMCKMATRIAFVAAFVVFGFSFFRTCILADDASILFLGEALLLCAVLISTASTSFYPVLFDLLFLTKNKRTAEKNGGSFVSVADMETVAGVDSFVLSTRSMFRSARYVSKYFETASGRRVTEKMHGTAELALIAEALSSMQKRSELNMQEEAVLSFCAKHLPRRSSFDIYAKATNSRYTLASYRTAGDGRSFSLVWGEAEALIPQLVYFSEDGKTRLIDAKRRDAMLEGVKQLKKNGYRFYLFAETQTRNTQNGGVPETFSDAKLLGFFALRKCSDVGAEKTIERLKAAGKKVFFIHDGENASWLAKEIAVLEDVPVIYGDMESFRDELAYFVKEERLPLCIGVHLTPQQKAQVVSALENAGRKVAAAGTSFGDHRMMCAATVAVAPMREDAANTPALVLSAASVRAKEHVSSAVETVQSAARLLSSFGILTAALCASLLGRTAVVLCGAIFGTAFHSSGHYALFGILFDLLALFCFAVTSNGKTYNGISGLIRENERNLCLFSGYVMGSVAVGALSSFVKIPSMNPESFVFVSMLLMLNVGLWYFSYFSHSTALHLYSIASVAVTVLVFLLGHLSDGRYGFLFAPQVLFWALIPVVVLMASGKLLEVYFMQKYSFKVGENNE